MNSRLLLRKNGGITVPEIQPEQFQRNVTVCIGLGGTGIDCLKAVKSKVYSSVMSDDPQNPEPRYSRVKFLAIDCDDHDRDRLADEWRSNITSINPHTEYFSISQPGYIEYLMKNPSMAEYDPSLREWFRINRQNFFIPSGNRQIGRCLFIKQSREFVNRFTELLYAAISPLESSKVYIHIFSGLGGGTGAGILLDVCYLVRSVLKQCRCENMVLGHFYLPDVNISRGYDEERARMMRTNACATLQELDYCMNFGNNGDKWSQVYSGGYFVEDRDAPVDQCYLLGATNELGELDPNGYCKAISNTANFVVDLITNDGGEYSASAVLANLALISSMVGTDTGASYRYYTYGSAVARIPTREVLTYLACGLFEKITGMQNNIPSGEDVKSFEEQHISFDTLYSALTNGCDMTIDGPNMTWRDALAENSRPKSYFDELYRQIICAVDRNSASMMGDLDDDHVLIREDSKSLMGGCIRTFRRMMSDPEMGPFYVTGMLDRTKHNNIFTVIEEYIADTNKKIAARYVAEKHLYDDMKTAEYEFFGSTGFLTGRARFERYCEKLRLITKAQVEQFVLRRVSDVLERLRRQLVVYNDSVIVPLKKTLISLIETFADNKEYLRSAPDDLYGYNIPIVTVEDIKQELDSEIDRIDFPYALNELMSELLNLDRGSKMTADAESVEALTVIRCINRWFRQYSAMSVTEYLEKKYRTQNVNALAMPLYNNTLLRMWDEAEIQLKGHSVVALAEFGGLKYPSASAPARMAADMMSRVRGFGRLRVDPSVVQNRITVMRYCCGIPLFVLGEYAENEEFMFMNGEMGLHIYEGKEYTDSDGQRVTGRDWRYLPSPIPYALGIGSDRLRELAEDAARLFDEALSRGLIEINRHDKNTYDLYTLSGGLDFILLDFREQANKIRTRLESIGLAEKMKQVREGIHLSFTGFSFNARTYTARDSSSFAGVICRDKFIYAPRLQETVRADLKALRELDELIEKCETMKEF